MGFEFEACRFGSDWRIYIRRQPGYQKRYMGATTIHRLTDKDGDYIYRSGHIRTREQAEAVAMLWADKTAEYIETGRTF